jgi:hypothetical protein
VVDDEMDDGKQEGADRQAGLGAPWLAQVMQQRQARLEECDLYRESRFGFWMVAQTTKGRGRGRGQ